MEYKRLYRALPDIDVDSICTGTILSFKGIDRIYILTNTVKEFLKGEELILTQKQYDMIDFTMNDAKGKEYVNFNLKEQIKYLIKAYPKLTKKIKQKVQVKEALLLRKALRTILNMLTVNLPNNVDDDGTFYPTKEEHGTTSRILWRLWYKRRKKKLDFYVKEEEAVLWFDRLKKERWLVIHEEKKELELEYRRVELQIKQAELTLLQLQVKDKTRGRRLK